MINATQLQLQLRIYINQLELELASSNITSCKKQLVQEELRNFRNHYAILTDLICIYERYGNRPEVPLTSDKQIEVLQLLYKSDDGDYKNKRVYTISVEKIMSVLREYQNVFVEKEGDTEIYDVSSNITIDDLDSFIIHFATRDTSLSKITGISSIPIRYYNVVANELKAFFPSLDDRQFLIQALSQISTNPTLQFTNELNLIFSSSDPNGTLAKLLWTGFHEYYREKEVAHLRDETFRKMVENLERPNFESYIKIKEDRVKNEYLKGGQRKGVEDKSLEFRNNQFRSKQQKMRRRNQAIMKSRVGNIKQEPVDPKQLSEENGFDYRLLDEDDYNFNTRSKFFNTSSLVLDDLEPHSGEEETQADQPVDRSISIGVEKSNAEINSDQL